MFFTTFMDKYIYIYASAIQYENLKSNSVTSEFNNAKVFMHECHQTNEKKNGNCRNKAYFAKKNNDNKLPFMHFMALKLTILYTC